MNYKFGREATCAGNDCFARRQMPNFRNDPLAFFQDAGPPSAMNGAIDSAAAQQRGVRRVHDGISLLFRDVPGAVELNRPLSFEGKTNYVGAHAAIQRISSMARVISYPSGLQLRE